MDERIIVVAVLFALIAGFVWFVRWQPTRTPGPVGPAVPPAIKNAHRDTVRLEPPVGFIESFNSGFPVNPVLRERTEKYYAALVEHIRSQRPGIPIRVLHIEGEVEGETASWVVCFTDTAHEGKLDSFYECRVSLEAPHSGEVISAHARRIRACLDAVARGTARELASFEFDGRRA